MSLRQFSKCSTTVKCYLFKTYCSNLCYAPLWYDYTVSDIKNKNKLPITTALDDYFAYLNIIVLVKCVYAYCLNIMSLGGLLIINYIAFVLD